MPHTGVHQGRYESAAAGGPVEVGATGSPPPVDFGSAAGPAVLRLMTEQQRRAAARLDPTVGRRFGVLP